MLLWWSRSVLSACPIFFSGIQTITYCFIIYFFYWSFKKFGKLYKTGEGSKQLRKKEWNVNAKLNSNEQQSSQKQWNVHTHENQGELCLVLETLLGVLSCGELQDSLSYTTTSESEIFIAIFIFSLVSAVFFWFLKGFKTGIIHMVGYEIWTCDKNQ